VLSELGAFAPSLLPRVGETLVRHLQDKIKWQREKGGATFFFSPQLLELRGIEGHFPYSVIQRQPPGLRYYPPQRPMGSDLIIAI